MIRRLPPTAYRLLFWLSVLCASAVNLAAQATVTVRDTIFNADATKAAGSLIITWKNFTAAGGQAIAAGKLTRSIADGAVEVALVPNIGATPAGTSYTVVYQLANGISYTEYWVIPASGPTTIPAVRTAPAPLPTVLVNQQQLALGTGMAVLLELWDQTSDPAGTREGQIFWRSDTNQIRVYDGAAWSNWPALGALPPGAANQLFKTNAAATAVEYATLAAGTAGTDFAVAFGAGTITLNLPDASQTARGAVTTGTQTIAGDKTLTGAIATKTLNQVRVADQFAGADACAKINAAIGDLPVGGGTVDARGFQGTQACASNPFSGVTKPVLLLLGAATYETSAAWTLPAKCSIVGLGDATVLKPTSGSINPINTGTTNDIAIRSLKIDGNFPTVNTTAIVIGATTAISSDIRIENVYITNAGAGISAVRVNRMWVDRSRFDTLRLTGVIFNDPGVGNTNQYLWVRGNFFKDVNQTATAGHAAVQTFGPRTHEHVWVESNYIENPGTVGIGLDGLVRYAHVTGNRVIGNGTAGECIAFIGSYNRITGNRVNNCGAAGILLFGSGADNDYNEISGNVLWDNSAGIDIVWSVNNTDISDLVVAENIAFNTAAGPAQAFGIQSYKSGGVTGETASRWWMLNNDFYNNVTAPTSFGVLTAQILSAPVADRTATTSLAAVQLSTNNAIKWFAGMISSQTRYSIYDNVNFVERLSIPEGSGTMTLPNVSSTIAGLAITQTFTSDQTFTGALIATGASATRPVKTGTALPGTCTANSDLFIDTDATPAGQQVYLCNSTGSGWNLVGDGATAHNLLSAAHGDTLAGTVVRGDIIVGNSTPAWARLAVGGANTVLASNGSDPSWTTLAKAHLPSAIAYEDEANTFTLLQLIQGSAGNIRLELENPDTPADDSFADSPEMQITGIRDATAGAGVSREEINWKLFADVTAVGGTSALVLQSRIGAAAFTERAKLTDGGVLDVATGFRIGGAAASGARLRGNGANFVSDSTSLSGIGSCTNQVVTALNNEASPTCTTVTSAFTSGSFPPNAHALLSSSHSDTLAGAVVRGDIVVGNLTPVWARLAVGGANTVLASNGTDPSWTTLAKAHLPAVIAYEDEANTFTAAQKVDESTITQEDDGIGVTSTDGVIVQNTTAAAAAAQQMSPRLRLTGQGWKTDPTAASQTVDWIFENLPVQGAANPTAELRFSSQVNGAGYTERLRLMSAGDVSASRLRVGSFGATASSLTALDVFNASGADISMRVTNNNRGFGVDIAEGGPSVIVKSTGTTQTLEFRSGSFNDQNYLFTSTADLITTGNLALKSGTAFKVTFDGAPTADRIQTVQDVADTFVYRASTDTLTNKTLDAEGTGNTVTVPIKIWIPAAGCNNATASSNWDLPTTSPAVAACRTGTNIQRGTLDFADASSLTAQQTMRLPNDWASGTDIAARVVWISSTLTGDVVWQIAIACASDADPDDPAFTDDAFTADTTKGTANQLNDTVENVVTTTGTCVAGDIMAVRIKRDSAHASDTMAGTARLVGVELTLRRAM